MVYTIPGAPSVHRPNDFTDSHSSNDLAAELKKVCLRKVVVARALAIRATYLVIQSLYYRAHGRNSQKSIEKTIFIKHTHTHTYTLTSNNRLIVGSNSSRNLKKIEMKGSVAKFNHTIE